MGAAMKKLEVLFENGIDDDALAKICEILINYDAKFSVTEYKQSSENCDFNRGGECRNSFAKQQNCVGLNDDNCPLVIQRRING